MATIPWRSALVLGLVAALLGLAPPARADGDPASDVLYVGWVFVPFTKNLTISEERLQQTVLAAKRTGYPIKVAIIGGPSDLGAVPGLFGKPQRYARFLGLELAFLYHGRLLVVMPNGFGVFHFRHQVARERRTLRTVTIGEGVDGLADSATLAVRRLAAANGYRLPAVTIPERHSSAGHDRLVIAAAALGFAALAGGAAWIWRRTRRHAG